MRAGCLCGWFGRELVEERYGVEPAVVGEVVDARDAATRRHSANDEAHPAVFVAFAHGAHLFVRQEHDVVLHAVAAGAAASVVPHSPQNFWVAEISVAQLGQRSAKGTPHSTQNRAFSMFSNPQP